MHSLSEHAFRGMHLLRERIRDAHVPRRHADNLRLATWNIRELGKGERSDESIAILATILREFDLVSIVELREDVRDLRRVLRVLGPSWQTVYSDYLRDAGGNRERNAFVFDTRRVRFTGLASTAESPREKRGSEYVPTLRWWRPPFLASFSACASRFDFLLVTAHVRWGSSAKGREAEIAALGDWILQRAREPYFGDPDVFVVGDFNVEHRSSPAFRELESRGLELAPGLEERITTSLAHDKRYDQILSVRRDARAASWFTGRAGCVDFYRGDHRGLVPRGMSKARFTRQVSDHLPLWAELSTKARRGERTLASFPACHMAKV